MSNLFTDSQGDVRTVEITSYDKETAEMEYRSKFLAEALSRHYPRYPWMVQWHSGGDVSVKLMLAADNNWGYIIDTDQCHTYRRLADAAIKAGGELLERLGMKRGAWDGAMPTKNYEGIEKSRCSPVFDTNNVKGVDL